MSDEPLHGVTVLDFSTRLPGPLATLMLAQAGARVIKIERPPTGDELRRFEPRLDGLSAHFTWLNRGKESVAVDLKREADRAALEVLLAGADVLVEQFRPGAMERLGLGWEALARRHPRLIYCSITGYGRDDPRSKVAAHDLNYQASAGLVGSSARGPTGLPVLPPVLLADIAGGSYPAFMSILLALMQREKTGRGQFVDIAMSSNVEIFAFWNVIQGGLTGTWPEPGGGRHTGGSPRYQVYATRDGQFLAVAALEDHFWQAFQEAIDLEIPTDWEQAAPGEVIAAVAGRIAQRDAEEWLTVFGDRDLCCNLAPNLRAAAVANAVSRAGDGEEGGLPYIPLPLAEQFTTGRRSPPAAGLGAHNALLTEVADGQPAQRRQVLQDGTGAD